MFDFDQMKEILAGDAPTAQELERELQELKERLQSVPNMPETEE